VKMDRTLRKGVSALALVDYSAPIPQGDTVWSELMFPGFQGLNGIAANRLSGAAPAAPPVGLAGWMKAGIRSSEPADLRRNRKPNPRQGLPTTSTG